MTPKDQETVRVWSRVIKGEPSISIVLNKGEQSRRIELFCDELVRQVPAIHLKKESDNDQPFPEIRIRNNVRYRAIPLENELEPFLYALSCPEPLSKMLPRPIRDTICQIKIPVFVKVFVSPHCIFCPRVVRECLSMAEANPLFNLIIIDGVLFPEMTKRDNILSVPTTILDNQFRWTGNLAIRDLANMAFSRDPVTLSPDSLIQIIQDGRAADLAEMMIDNNTVFPSFTELLIHDKWPVRLGAMVCFEYLAEKSPDLSSLIINTLWNRFPYLNEQLKGDILYLMGQSPNPETSMKLRSVINGEYPSDLKEAAQEAIDSLEGR